MQGLEYCDEEMEEVRVKAPGEEGYLIPPEVDSARKRALELEKKKKAAKAAEAKKVLEKNAVMESDETKTKEQYMANLEERGRGLSMESSEVLKDYRIADMRILDSFDPMYEFEE